MKKVIFLGVIIDDKLKWDAHISHLETRLLSSITMIKRIRKFIPRRFDSQLYYSLFQSHLVFGISAWGGACSSKLIKVFAYLPFKNVVFASCLVSILHLTTQNFMKPVPE